MSIWQDKPEQTHLGAKSVDVLFRMQCKRILVDHARELATALGSLAPWINTVPNIGVHSIHVAGSQNGWERPDASSGEWLMPSKRTRLRVRVPRQYAQELIDILSQTELTVGDEKIAIASATIKELEANTTLFARACSFDNQTTTDSNESDFTVNVIAACREIGFEPNKILCGKSMSIQAQHGPIHCRSVMIADIPRHYSLTLQDAGLGKWRLLGCGILLPHKDTAAVN